MDQRPKNKTPKYKTLRRKHGPKTLDLVRISWISHQKHRQKKVKIGKLDFIKIKDCASWGIVSRAKYRETERM